MHAAGFLNFRLKHLLIVGAKHLLNLSSSCKSCQQMLRPYAPCRYALLFDSTPGAEPPGLWLKGAEAPFYLSPKGFRYEPGHSWSGKLAIRPLNLLLLYETLQYNSPDTPTP